MANYDEVLSQVKLLTLHEQAQLLEELATIVHYRVKSWPEHSFLELEGLGKEVWEGVDVDKYIEEERNSWE
jgi:hypothetical protein